MNNNVYAVVNQKGGSGKTTTTVSLAGILALNGIPVRLIDSDPQSASATSWVLPNFNKHQGLLEVFLDNKTLDEVTVNTEILNLDIIPSWLSLKDIETKREPGSEQVLQLSLQESKYKAITLIDCPPNLDILSIASITAANNIIITVQPSELDLIGLNDMLKLFNKIKKRLNPFLKVVAIIVTRLKGNSGLDQDIIKYIKDKYNNIPLFTVRDSVRIREAISAHKPINLYDSVSSVSMDYYSIAESLFNIKKT